MPETDPFITGYTPTTTKNGLIKRKDIPDPFEVGYDPYSINRPKISVGDINEFGSQFMPTGGFDALRRQRAEAQSGGRQLINTAAKTIPAIGLGILENAGYLLELPNALLSDQKDFSNSLVEWSQETRESLETGKNLLGLNLPVYRESPEEVFDLSDPAWWYQHGGGLVESIGEFLVTGAGVGSVAGKGAAALAKTIGGKTAARIGQGAANVLTSGSLAYTEGAMSGSQIYKDVYSDYLSKNPNDFEGANKLASDAASKTVKLNTSINTFLNLTGIAPLFSKNASKAINSGLTSQVGEKAVDKITRYSGVLDDLIEKGFKKTRASDHLLRELIQEGVEEQVNLAAEVSGRLKGGLITEEEAGGATFGEIFFKQAQTEEGILNFILGGIGGVGQTLGINLLSGKKRAEASEYEFKQKKSNIEANIDALKSMELLRNQLQEVTKDNTLEDNVKFEKQESLKNSINNQLNTLKVRQGTSEALIGTYQEIANIDNIKDLGEEIQPRIDELTQQIVELEATPETNPEEIVQMKQELVNLKKEQKSLLGNTDAMIQGLARDKNDNDYREVANSKVQEVKDLEKKYKEYQNKYNYTEEAEAINVAGEVLRRYGNKNTTEKSLSESNTSISNLRSDLTKVHDENTPFLFLQGEKEALQLLQEQYSQLEKLDLRKNKNLGKRFEAFNTTEAKKIRKLIKERQSLIKKKLKEINKSIEAIPNEARNVTEDDINPIVSSLAENTELELLVKQLNEDFNNLAGNKKNRDEFTSTFNKEVEKLKDEQEKEDDKINNDLVKNIKSINDYANKYKDNAQNALTPEELIEFNTLIDKIEADDSLIGEKLTRLSQLTGQIQRFNREDEGTPFVEEDVDDIPEPHDQTKSYDDDPTKGTNLESEDSDPDSRIAFDTGSSITTLGSKPFKVIDKKGTKITTSNLLNEIYPEKLMTGLIKLGDKIVLEVDKNATKTEGEGKDTIEINLYDKFKDDINNFPIKMTHNGDFIGHLRVQDSINEGTTVDKSKDYNLKSNIAFQKDINLRLREFVRDNGGKIETTIEELGGNTAISKNVEIDPIRTVEDAIKNPEVEIGIVKHNSVQIGGKEIVVNNSDKFLIDFETRPVLLVSNAHGKKTEFSALPVSLSLIDENTSEVLTDAINAFIRKNKDSEIWKIIDEKLDIDITTPEGLDEYLNDFVFTTFISKEKSLEISRTEDEGNKRYLTIGNKEIHIQKKGEARKTINIDNLDAANYGEIKSHIENMYFNIRFEKLRKDIIKIIKTEEGYNSEVVDYDTHTKQITKTNIYENVLEYNETTYYSYFDNPTFYSSLPFAINDLIEKHSSDEKKEELKTEKSKVISKTQGEKKKEKDEEKELKEGDVIDFNNLKNLISKSELNKTRFDDKDKPSGTKDIDSSPILSKDEEKFSILQERLSNKLDVPIDFLNNFVDHLYVDMLYDLYTGESNLIKSAKSNFINQIEALDNDDPSKRFFQEKIIPDLDDYIKLAVDKLNFILDDSLIVDDTVDLDALENTQGVYERKRWEDDANFSIDNKSLKNPLIRKFLSIIPDRDQYGNQKNLYFSIYVPFDIVYNTLKTILAGSENSFDAMRNKLVEHSSEITWLNDIIKRFDNPPLWLENEDTQRLKNQFVTLMSNAQYNFKNIQYTKNKDGSYNSYIIASDRSANFRLILKKWQENLKESSIVDRTSEILKLDKLELKKITDFYDAGIEGDLTDKKIKEFISTFFNSIGIIASDKTINHLLKYKVNDVSPLNLLSSKESILNQIKKGLNITSDEEIKSFEDRNPLFNNSAIEQLARIESRNNDSIHANSFQNIEKKNVVSINLQRQMNRRFQDLNKKGLTDELMKLPFNRDSHDETWLKKFNDKDQHFINNIFQLDLLDGITDRSNNLDGIKSNSFSLREQEGAKMMAFFHGRGFEGSLQDNKVAEFLHFVPSKNVTYMIKAPKQKVIYKNEELNETSIDLLYSIVKSEINRINADIKYFGAKGKKFLIFNSLNKLDIFSDGEVIESKKNDEGITVEELIRADLRNQIDLMIDDKKEYWKSLEIIKDGKLDYIPRSNQTLDGFIASYIVNQIWFQYNMIQSFTGDPAQYGDSTDIDKLWNNSFKRLTKDITPALEGTKDPNNTQYVQISLKEKFVDSKYIENFKEIDSTDAQEYTTIEEDLFNLYQLGRISTENYNNALNAAKKGENVGKIVPIQPKKPVARGKRIIEENKVNVTETTDFIKSSSISLYKYLTDGLPIDRVRKALEKVQKDEGKFVRASYESANKVGTAPNPVEIFNEDGSLKENIIIENTETQQNYVTLDRSGFGIQQEIPFKGNEVVDGTQQRKIILSALTLMEKSKAKKIAEEYNSTYERIFSQRYAELNEELTNPNGSINMQKFSKMLIKEAKKRDWNDKDVKGLELEGENFKFPLYLNHSSDRIEKLLTSIINNRIIRNKRQGKSLVLISQEGFEGFGTNWIYTDSYDGELKPQRIEDGKILPAQVIVPRSLFKLLPTKKVDSRIIVDFDKISPDLFKSLDFRIPTQTYNNSMSSIEIVGFFPEGFEDGILAPREFIEQMGSDFDVDSLKLFTYESEEGKKIDSDNNTLLDLELEILNDKDVFKKHNEKLSSDKIEEYIEENNLDKTSSEISKIYDTNFSKKYNEARDGAEGIKRFATLGTFISLAANVPNSLSYKEVNDLKLKGVSIKDEVLNINHPFARDGRLKIDVVSQFENASLDNESNPLLGKIHANNYTFNAAQTLITLGYIEKDIIDLINSPVVIAYVNNLQIMFEDVTDSKNITETKALELTIKKFNSEEDKETLELFKRLSDRGTELSQIKAAINIDSVGIPKDLIDVQDKLVTISELKLSQDSENIEGVDQLFKDNIVEHTTEYGLNRTQDIWRALGYPYGSNRIVDSFVQSTFNKIEDVSGKVLNSQRKKEVYKEIKNFIYSNSLGILPKQNIYKERQRLLFGDRSVANQTEKLQNEGIDNIFVKALYVDKGDNIKDGRYVKFNNAARQGVQEDFLYAAFNELLTDSRYSDYAENLIHYSFITNSNITPTNFIKYIPIEYFDTIGMTPILKAFNFEKSVDNTFTLQFFRNNPKYAGAIDFIATNVTPKEGDLIKEFVTFREDTSSIVSYYDTEDKSWRLYLQQGETSTYKLISTLGDNRKGNQIKEYDSNNELIQSVFDKNNVSDVLFNIQERRTNEIEYSVEDVEGEQAFLSKYNTDSYSSFITSLLKKADLDENQKLIFKLLQGVDSENPLLKFENVEGETGSYNVDNHTIILPTNVKSESRLIEIFLEEALHSVTSKTVNLFNDDKSKLSKDQIKFVNRIEGLRKNYQEQLIKENPKDFKRWQESVESGSGLDPELVKFYRASNTKEFIIGIFVNLEVQKNLNEKEFTEGKSLIDRFVEILRDFLKSFKANLNVKVGTELDEAISSIIGIIEKQQLDVSNISLDIDKSPILSLPNNEQLETINDGIEVELLQRNLIDAKGNPTIFNYNDAISKFTELTHNLQGYNIIPIFKENSEGYYIDIVENISGTLDHSPKINTREANFINEIQNNLNRVDKNIATTKKEGDKVLRAILIEEKNTLEKQINELIDKKGASLTIAKVAEEQLNHIVEVLDRPSITAEELHLSMRTISLYTRLENYLLDKSRMGGSDPEYTNSVNVHKLIELRTQAGDLEIRWVNIARKFVKEIGKDVKIDLTKNELFGYNSQFGLGIEGDINYAQMQTLDISTSGSPVMSIIYKLVKYSKDQADVEKRNDGVEIDTIIGNFRETKFFKTEGGFERLHQKLNGFLTGNFINRTGQEYFEKSKELSNHIKTLKANNADESDIDNAYKIYNKWLKENNIYINVSKLFKRDDNGNIVFKDNASYRHELEKLLGSSERVDDAIQNSKNKMEEYEGILKAEIERIDALDYNSHEAFVVLKEWKLANSPFEYIKNINEDISAKDSEGRFIKNEGWRYIYSEAIPKWHDSDFDFIDSYTEIIDGKEVHTAKEFYRWYIEKINDYYRIAPDSVFEEFQYNYLPIIPTGLVDEIFSLKGMMSKSANVLSRFLKGLEGKEAKLSKDRILEKPDPEMHFPFQEKEFRTEDEKKRSITGSTRDLQEIMKIISEGTLLYKHAKQIEDKVRVAEIVFDFQKQVEISDEGISGILERGKALTKKKSQLSHFVLSGLYGLNPAHKEDFILLSAEKVTKLNPNDRKTFNELEEELKELEKVHKTISKKEYDKRKKSIDEKIKSLSSPITSRKVARAFLNYVQAKGMGWNVLAAVNNFMFAWIQNYVHSAGGEDFSSEDFRKATTKVLHSTGNILPGIVIGGGLGTLLLPGFGTILGSGVGALFTGDTQGTKEAKKINSLMRLYKTLGKFIDVNDFETDYNNNHRKWYERFGFYELQRKSEYFSYGTTMVAMMLKKKVKTEKQGEVSLYDIYDINGEINTEKYGKIEEFDEQENGHTEFKLKLDQVNKIIHGNYDEDSSTKIKETILGQMLMQFRGWLPEAINTRFGNEKRDDVLERQRSGRYMLLRGRNDKFELIIRSLLRVAFLQSNNIYNHKNLKKHEVANLKKNIMEVRFISMILIMTLGLKWMDDEDEDPKREYAINFALNSIFRLQDDLLFYSSPSSIENMSNNLVPALKVVGDARRTFNYAFKVLFDDDADDKTTEALYNNGISLLPTGSGLGNVIKAHERVFPRK